MMYHGSHWQVRRRLCAFGITALSLTNVQCSRCSSGGGSFQVSRAELTPSAIISGIHIAAARIQDSALARVALDCTAVNLPTTLFGVALNYEIVGPHPAHFVTFEQAAGTAGLVAGGAKGAGEEMVLGLAGADASSNIGGSYAIGTFVIEVGGPGEYALRALAGSVAAFSAGGAVLAAAAAPNVAPDTLVIQ